ncbi:tudor domain-containing 6 [Odontesthes bonariensis]|uniref:tudor domain-containing 6 n=1 Tax=Odontesthes bonariensis TaxID=219752 RepID=UPI003F58477A
MCSIPGLPTPGTEVPVLITRVNQNPNFGIVELWVNMDDGRKHIYEQMREEIQTPQRRFDGSEGKPGELCLVCISDTWHRARIILIQGKTFSVFLIDQGKPHITTSDALAWGQSDCFLLPPEIESCILANVLFLQNELPERVTKFLMCLSGKKFKGVVQHVLMPDRIILLEIPILTKHMCKLGAAKIKVDEFKILAQKCLQGVKGESSETFCLAQELNLDGSCELTEHDQYFYPELLTDTFETVIVTEVTDLRIFCKIVIFSKAVKLLSEQIHQHYEESSDFGDARPQSRGDPCASRGLDGRWHRSLLKKNIVTSDVAVEVFHVDEGKTEVVNVGDIRPMLGKFLRMPVVTYLCALNGMEANSRELTADETEDLKLVLLNHTVVAKFDHYNKPQDVYYVTLYEANGTCINSIFLEGAGRKPSSKPGQDLNVQSEPLSFPLSFGDEQFMNLHCELNVTNGLPEEIWQSTKNPEANGSMGDTSTSNTNDIHIKASSEVPDPLLLDSGHLSTTLPSEGQNACDDGVLAVGKSVNVNVSCIESSQRFWCQTAESGDSLRHLMQDLQNHYASAHSQPLLESICVARNPDNAMWYRARIIASQDSPVVDVRFIDYGQTQRVPLRDVLPIDPAFLLLNAQAFQCSLFSLKSPTNPMAVSLTVTELQKFLDLGTSSDVGLKCIIKAVASDEDGLLLNIVDLESASKSARMYLAQKHAQSEAQGQIPPQVPSDAYSYSTPNIEVGGTEKVLVTSSETVGHFYCQLHRNLHLFDKMMENVSKLLDQPQSSNHKLGLNSICLARYSDGQWYRGQVVEISPKLKVHFVDYGDTLTVCETDICPITSEASIISSVPVQAVPLGLFDVPAELPQEVNQWFTDHAVGHSFTISVVAKEEKGKLIVELFDGSLNVNLVVREKVAKIRQHKMTGLIRQSNQQLTNGSKSAALTNGDCSTHELRKASISVQKTEQNEIQSSNGIYVAHDVSTPQTEHVKILNEGSKPTLDVILESKETVSETSTQDSHGDLDMTQHSSRSYPEENVNTYMYTWPNISVNITMQVYASSIVGPDYFWCQPANTDDLNMVLKLAQEAGQGHHDVIPPEMLKPGIPCLALFSSDSQWYRAQVIQRTDSTLHVLFVDYGNESEVDINNVKLLPRSLLEMAPQACLCHLNGFNESKGSWDDEAYDDFHSLLVDKPLKVTILGLQIHPEIAVPQYTVKAVCDGVVINDSMQKYWNSFSAEHCGNGVAQADTLPQSIQTEGNMTSFAASEENIGACIYKVPEISKSETEMVYASCVSEPHFFWCQFAEAEDLHKVSQLAQEAGQTQQDMLPQTVGPGSPCLALFSSDNQWYRAQVIRKADKTLHVVFVDYGNESEVDIKDVKPLPQSLLETAPQAFLCSLNGFDVSQGSWNDEACDDFYHLVVDKPLKLSVISMKDHSEIAVPLYSVEIECKGEILNETMQKYWKQATEECVVTESPQTEGSLQGTRAESNMTHLCVSEKNVGTCVFKEPLLSRNKAEMVYASCIAEPYFFWCQFAHTEDLHKLSQRAQEAGRALQDNMSPETLGPGSPCLTLFSSDNQWYRAQVIRKTDQTLHVLFVDYGNESEVDIKNVRLLPQSLLETTPQAFLCRLNGFEKSEGSWDDKVYDDFYNLLVDKLLKLTVFDMGKHPDIAIPQYAVEIECEGVVVNTLMEKYWKVMDTNGLVPVDQSSVDQEETRTIDEGFGV